MEAKQTFKLVGYYRLLSWLSFGVGIGLVALGVFLGLGETFRIVANDFPAEFDAAVAAANPVPTVVLAVLGIVVWQVGKSIALTKTMERAIDVETESTDDGRLKSEILDVVNDQVASVESDLRSEIDRVERGADDDALTAGTAVATADRSSGSGGEGPAGSGTDGPSGRSGRSRRSDADGDESRNDDAGGTDEGRGDKRATDEVAGGGSGDGSRRSRQGSDDDPLP